MAGVIDSAVNWAVSIANNAAHGYSMNNRWGPDYDCSSFIISAYEQAGVKVKAAGATYTGDMRKAFLQCGFEDVTAKVSLSDGKRLKRGDVIFNSHHAIMAATDNALTIVHASTDEDKYTQSGDQTGKEICTRKYYSDNWECVLRYTKDTSSLKAQRERVIEVPDGLGKIYTYMHWDKITRQGTQQMKLIERAGKNYDSDGYGIIGHRKTLAMTSTFGEIGDYVDVYMKDGSVIYGILADEKDQTWAHGTPANKWGHYDGQNVVEFVTNWKGRENPKGNGGVVKVVNVGSYFDYPEYASGGSIEEYMYSENSYNDNEATVVWNNRVSENISPVLTSSPKLLSVGELALFVQYNNITAYAGNLTWHNSISELSTTLSFETPKSDAKYIDKLIYIPSAGDIVSLVTDDEVFRGVIISVDDGDKNVNKYNAVDLGWYLNKTKQTYQFNDIPANDAIKQICDDLHIPVAMMPDLDGTIRQIYFDSTISDILKDILDRQSGEFNFDFVPDGLRIYRIGELQANPGFSAASNVKEVNSLSFLGDLSRSYSIEDMKNSIKVTSEKDSVYTELTVVQDRDSINKFGFLQEIVNIDPEKENADTVAWEKFRELSHGKQELSFKIIEKFNSYSRAGEVFCIGAFDYVIEDTEHSFNNGFHYNKMSVRRI